MATTELGEDPTVPSVLGRLGPNWFASVMGTGIVANAAPTLPVHIHGLRVFADAVWVLAAVLLIVLIIVVGGHWLRAPDGGPQACPKPADGAFLRCGPDGTTHGRYGIGADRLGFGRRGACS
jgi:hypothetical protein